MGARLAGGSAAAGTPCRRAPTAPQSATEAVQPPAKALRCILRMHCSAAVNESALHHPAITARPGLVRGASSPGPPASR